MRKYLICALWLALPCIASAGLETGIQVEVDGKIRRYDLYVPSGLGNNPVPLVIDMHGWTQPPEDQRSRSGFRELADTEKFIVAWPQGFGFVWYAYFGQEGIDDVGGLRAIVAHIASQRAIDPQRVYATGWSQGGDMSYRLACDAADLFAAVASIAGGILVGSEPQCMPVRTVPILSFRGTDDQIVPYGGGLVSGTSDSVLSASRTHDFWKEINNCKAADQNLSIGNTPCDRNTNCEGDVAVMSCATTGGGGNSKHDLYRNSSGVNIAHESWDFFQQFTLPDIEPAILINPGLNDAWFNNETPGQGFLIVVFPDTGIVFLAWFTFDTERPPEDVAALLGEPGHRWVTAQGPFDGDTANLTAYLTEGGVFDSVEPPAITDVDSPIGAITIVWHDCESATLSYDIDPPGVTGDIPLRRIVPDNVALCEALSGP